MPPSASRASPTWCRSVWTPRSPEPAAAARSGPEEVPEQGGAFVLQDARVDLWAVVQASVPDHVPEGAHRAGLRLPGAEDQPGDPGQDQRAGAHRARFQRHDQGALRQPPAAGEDGGPAQRDDLLLRGRVAGPLAFVARRGQFDAVRAVDPRARRHVGGDGGGDGQGPPHPGLVLGPEHQASRSSSSSSPQPSFWQISAVTSAGSMPSRPQRVSSRCELTPRSASSSMSPTGSASGSAAGRSSSSSLPGAARSSISSAGASMSASSSAPRRDSSAYAESEPKTRRSSISSRRRITRY